MASWRSKVTNSAPRTATAPASGSPNSSAARADASTTLTAIAVGADQGDGLARGLQPQPARLGQDFGGCQGAVLDGGVDDGQKFALQGAAAS